MELFRSVLYCYEPSAINYEPNPTFACSIFNMKADYRIFELPFQYPFTISKGTKTHQPTFVVSLEHFGRTGYGEAPAIHYYDVTTAKLEMVFKAKKMFIEKFAFTEPAKYAEF